MAKGARGMNILNTDTLERLASMICNGDNENAVRLAAEVVEAVQKRDAENEAERVRRAEEAAEEAAVRARKSALLVTHGAALRREFRAAGKHLAGNGYRWGQAARRAGALSSGSSDSNWTQTAALEWLVTHALGFQPYWTGGRRTTVHDLHPPDPEQVARMCAAIRATPNAHGQTGEERAP